MDSELNLRINLVVMQVVRMRMTPRFAKLKSAKLEDFLFRIHSNDKKIDPRVPGVTSVVTRHAKRLVIAYSVIKSCETRV